MLAESRVLSRELDIFLKGGSQILGVMSAKPSFRNTGTRWKRMGQMQEMSEEQLYCQEKVPDVQATYWAWWTGLKGPRECRVPHSWKTKLLVVSRTWPGEREALRREGEAGRPHRTHTNHLLQIWRVRGRWLCCHWCIHRIWRPQPCPEGCW